MTEYVIMYLLKQRTNTENDMKLSKTTINFAAKRNIDITVSEFNEMNLVNMFSQELDYNIGYETSMSYIANENGTFTFYNNLDFVSSETKEELPAFIKDEKHLREVIEFIAAEAA